MPLQHEPYNGSDDDRHLGEGHFTEALPNSVEVPTKPTIPSSNRPISWEEPWDWDQHWDRSPHNHDQGDC
jgi:hypothetical protein